MEENKEKLIVNNPAEEATPEESLKAVIAKQAIEEEASGSASFTLRKILGGDFLTAEMLRKQIWLIVLIAAFTLIYVSNRYNCQKDMLEINELNEKLKDAKYRALASSSQLTEACRESNVLKMLQENQDSTLHIPTQPPFISKIPKNQ